MALLAHGSQWQLDAIIYSSLQHVLFALFHLQKLSFTDARYIDCSMSLVVREPIVQLAYPKGIVPSTTFTLLLHVDLSIYQPCGYSLIRITFCIANRSNCGRTGRPQHPSQALRCRTQYSHQATKGTARLSRPNNEAQRDLVGKLKA